MTDLATQLVPNTNIVRLLSIATVSEFLTSGNSTITLVNEERGTRVTLKAIGKALRDAETKEWLGRSETEFTVYVFTGSDNESHYTEIGEMSASEAGLGFNRRRSRIRSRRCWNTARVAQRTMNWLLSRINEGRELPETVSVFNEGRCRKCGKKLVVPSYSSADGEVVAGVVLGLGPECAGRGCSADTRKGETKTVKPRMVDRAAFAEACDAENPANLGSVVLVPNQPAVAVVEKPRMTMDELFALLDDGTTDEDW